MAVKRYLLTIPNSGGPILLMKPLPIGHDDFGNERYFDTLDPDCFGKRLMGQADKGLRWRAASELKWVARLPELNAFYGGVIASPRVKQCIEHFQSDNIEFIPLDIYYEKTDEKIAEWWFINVFNWKDVFDYEISQLDYADYEFPTPLNCMTAVSARFGRRPISSWTSLKINKCQTSDGLFLAKSSSRHFWHNIFISMKLANELKKFSIKPNFFFFKYFWCDNPPGDQFCEGDYEYCGA